MADQAGLTYEEILRTWREADAIPELAVLLHSVVGGTPAYRREFAAFDAPDGRGDFDAWLLRTVLNPQSPLFREARPPSTLATARWPAIPPPDSALTCGQPPVPD